MHRVYHYTGGSLDERALTSREMLRFLHELADERLENVHEGKQLTMDMDGVIIYDDNAVQTVKACAGNEGVKAFERYAKLNLLATEQNGTPPYCWYAPTIFASMVLEGLSADINRAVGNHMRLIPDVERHVGCLRELGYDITAVTAGHQEAAESVASRAGIDKVVGTVIGLSEDGLYEERICRFLGHSYKTEAIKDILNTEGGCWPGTHIGDSYSDIDALRNIPSAIAFNPGCYEALEAAPLSVVATSHLALLPLLDIKGKYDKQLDAKQLPMYLIINDGIPDQGHMADIRRIKKQGIASELNDGVEESIHEELKKRGLSYQSNIAYLPDKDFDELACMKYEEFRKWQE